MSAPRSVRARLMKADLSAALAATRKRAKPLLRGVVRVMTDMEVINAMDGLIQLMCREPRTLADARYDELCMSVWIGVREYVAAYASRDFPRDSKKTKKPRRR